MILKIVTLLKTWVMLFIKQESIKHKEEEEKVEEEFRFNIQQYREVDTNIREQVQKVTTKNNTKRKRDPK